MNNKKNLTPSVSLSVCQRDCAVRLSSLANTLLQREWTDTLNKRRYTARDVGLFVRMYISHADSHSSVLQTLQSDIVPRLLEADDDAQHANGYPTLTTATFGLFYNPVYRAVVDSWLSIVEAHEAACANVCGSRTRDDEHIPDVVLEDEDHYTGGAAGAAGGAMLSQARSTQYSQAAANRRGGGGAVSTGSSGRGGRGGGGGGVGRDGGKKKVLDVTDLPDIDDADFNVDHASEETMQLVGL